MDVNNNGNVNPQSVLMMALKGDINGLKRIAEEECKKRNINVNDAINQIKKNNRL